MKLTYRGTTYNYNPPAVDQPTETVGKYRGLDWRFRNPQKALVQQPTLDLMYRGAAYHPQADAPVAVPQEVPTAVASVQPAQPLAAADRARSRMLHHQRVIKNRQQALLSRSATEVGLTTDISKYWNRIQGKVHPTFRLNYDRSGAALS